MSTAASQFRFERYPVIVVMGVSGSGKSSVAAELADRLSLPFLDGDDFHPQSNRDKMSQGIPLTDDDRWPWLDILGAAINNTAAEHGGAIATCSALRRVYRNRLTKAIDLPVVYVHLTGCRETLLKRMQARKNHYMPPSLLDSQLATLEDPEPDEPVITLSIEPPVTEIVAQLLALLQVDSAS